MKLLNIRSLFLVLITGLIISACSKDETPAIDLAGTWTAGTPTYTVKVGTRTLTQYFTEVAGLSAGEAELYTNLFNQGIQQSYTGTLKFFADNTYIFNMGGGIDTGTWSLSSDGKKLTIDSSTDAPKTADIIELTSGKLHIKFSESISEDLNNDETPETISIDVDMNLTR
jgi:hypothetical protein